MGEGFEGACSSGVRAATGHRFAVEVDGSPEWDTIPCRDFGTDDEVGIVGFGDFGDKVGRGEIRAVRFDEEREYRDLVSELADVGFDVELVCWSRSRLTSSMSSRRNPAESRYGTCRRSAPSALSGSKP